MLIMFRLTTPKLVLKLATGGAAILGAATCLIVKTKNILESNMYLIRNNNKSIHVLSDIGEQYFGILK